MHPGITGITANHVTSCGNACWRHWSEHSCIKTRLFNRLGFQRYNYQFFEWWYSNICCIYEYKLSSTHPCKSQWTHAQRSHWRRKVINLCRCTVTGDVHIGTPFSSLCICISFLLPNHAFSLGYFKFWQQCCVYIWSMDVFAFLGFR